MNFRKSTRYALYAAMEMARAETQVTAAQAAQRYSIPDAVMAKVFQQLVRAGLAVGTRGVGGGYNLARGASEITVLDVIEGFEPSRGSEECLLTGEDEGQCNDLELCRLRKLFNEVEETARSTYASVTLETLVGIRVRRDVKLRIIR